MRFTAAAACLGIGGLLTLGCSPASRHKVLSVFFDGVPPPESDRSRDAEGREIGARRARPAPVRYQEHGPYAARLCGACHEAKATNALVVPKEQLCAHCHQIALAKTHVHGPLASGGCLVCHDPHSSQYRFLLVSESESFCFHCHDREALTRSGTHPALGGACTSCHDAHMSDKKFLLK